MMIVNMEAEYAFFVYKKHFAKCSSFCTSSKTNHDKTFGGTSSSLKVSRDWDSTFYLDHPRCCFHSGDGCEIPPLILFKHDILKKCKGILEIRRQQKIKYHDVFLPDSPDTIHGYHKSCYSRFTAISGKQRDAYQEHLKSCSTLLDDSASASRHMRSNSSKIISSDSRIFKRICLFCKSANKKYHNEKQKLVKCDVKCAEEGTEAIFSPFQKSIIKFAEILEDDELLAQIRCVDVFAKEVHYHNICCTRYQA